MRHVARWTLVSLLCLPGIQHWPTQAAACGDDYACATVRSADVAARPDQSSAAVQVVNLSVQERCSGTAVDVTAASPDERRLACSAAKHALQLLDRCNISPRNPLHLQIMSEVRHPLRGAIFGLFDIRQARVLVTHMANIPALVMGTPYAELPQADFYRSLIVHEVVHGVMHQNLKRPAATHAAYEYPAYALQIESLAPGVREKFLQTFERAAITENTIFNDSVLLFDPYFFAARAYHHFKTSIDGCVHLNKLLDGEVDFIGGAHM